MQTLTVQPAAQSGLYVNPNVVLPRAKSVPGYASKKIVQTQEQNLAAAVAAGPCALLAFAKAEQKKRETSALLTVHHYSLFTMPGARFASAIINHWNGNVYVLEITGEGVKRFVYCADQPFVDSVNDALRAAGETFRLETKHATLWHFLERGVFHAGVGGMA